MINLYFNCEKQILTRTDREDLASNSREIHKCNFNLSNDWDDMQVTVVFKYMGRKWDVLLTDNACTVPAEVLEGQEGFTVGLYGTNGDQVITSTLITVPVSKGANASGGGNAQITPSMFDQIMEKIEEIEEGQIDPESIEAAIEEYFRENPDAVINTSEVFNAIVNSGLINLNIKYTYYKDHDEKTDAAAGVNYYVIAPGHIGGYDSNDYGTVMVNINEGGALAESIYEFYTSGNNLPEGKYQLRNAWSIGTPGVSVIFAYVNEGVEHVLATVDSEHEAAYFEITEEIAEYSQKLYIKVNPGAEYGGQINPLLTYGYVTDFSNIPGCYVATNTELTREVNNLKDSTTNLQGRVLNIETGKQDKIQYAVMPAASADLLGKIYQYTAATNANYTEGHWYKCVENAGVYSWEDLGGDGTVPNITAAATVDNTTGTPAVNVSKTGTDAAPEFTFEFTGLKGPKGDPGESGDQSVWEVQGILGAKNLLGPDYFDGDSMVNHAITYTKNADGSITCNGTADNYSKYYIKKRATTWLKAGTYTLSCAELADLTGSLISIQIGTDDFSRLASISPSTPSTNFTVAQDGLALTLRIWIDTGGTVDNATLRPMVRYAVDTDNTYHPYAKTNKELTNEVNDLKANAYLQPYEGITCWGDSLTTDSAYSWSTRLGELSGLTIFNAGTGGEDAQTIMARQGGDVMQVNNITIPATTTPVIIGAQSNGGIDTELGRKADPAIGTGTTHANPVMIANIMGTMRLTNNGEWTFARTTAGEQVVIDRPTAIRTKFDRLHNSYNDIMIIFMGSNGWGSNDVDELVNMHKLMIEHFKGKEYIVLGFSKGSTVENAGYEAAMKEAFGRRFISLREYLAHPIYENGEIVSCYGLADQGLTPGTKEYNGVTYVALDEIAQGIVPHQILEDSIHFTRGTKEVIGNMLYKKMQELNILA